MEITKEKSKAMTPAELWDAQELLDVFTCDELIRIVQNKPKYKPLFYKWLWREETQPEEALLDNPDLYEMYREELIADRGKVMDYFGTDGVLVVDYRDQVRNSLMREDGWALDETNEFEEREKQRAIWAKENEEHDKVARKAREDQAEADAEEKASRSDHDIFMDALNDCYMDDIFKEAERFKAEIHANIQDIAENYCEGNEVCLTSEAPDWLIELFNQYSVYYVKG